MRQDENKTIEDMLCAAYDTQSVPEDVNIRLKNQIACKRAMETGGISLWWLPATVNTIISAAFSIILITIYTIINIKGANTWMPNLLQLVSQMWLKIHLAGAVLGIVTSWLITFAGIWKANLFRSARIL